MLQTKIISEELCAVAYDPTEIMVRKRGKSFFGTAKYLARIKDGKLYISENVAKEFGIEICRMNTRTRDDLLVTMGARAAYMECKGIVELPSGVEGEYQLSKFVSNKVDHYIDNEIDESFDCYIEEALMKKYGVKKENYTKSN